MEKSMFLNASHVIFKRAEELRNNMTESEIILWDYLKQKPKGYKFRRQHPISTYIADFYCHSLKMIIEIDGDVHMVPEVVQNDMDRQEKLERADIFFYGLLMMK